MHSLLIQKNAEIRLIPTGMFPAGEPNSLIARVELIDRNQDGLAAEPALLTHDICRAGKAGTCTFNSHTGIAPWLVALFHLLLPAATCHRHAKGIAS